MYRKKYANAKRKSTRFTGRQPVVEFSGSILVSISSREWILSDTGEDQLADRASGLDPGVGPPQVLGIQGAEALAQRRTQRAVLVEVRGRVQDLMLGLHVRRLKLRAGEHQLPAERHALAHEDVDGERLIALRAHDAADLPLGLDDVGHVLDVLLRAVEAEDVVDQGLAEPLELPGERLPVIDDLLRSQRPAPLRGLAPGGGGEHPQARDLPGDLNGD